ncbi:MAG TPA: hypothetical protein VMV69_28015 [Pirellulales bacterium]|nr:hypothetical protein [Pirellulales bacterium]
MTRRARRAIEIRSPIGVAGPVFIAFHHTQPPTFLMSASLNEAFDRFISRVTKPATIGELTAAFMGSVPIPPEYRDAALEAVVKQDLRRAIHRAVSPDGTPLLISLPDVDRETGGLCRRYKQLAMFNLADYLKAWRQYDQAEETARNKKRAIERHHDARRISDRPLRQLALLGADEGAAGAA